MSPLAARVSPGSPATAAPAAAPAGPPSPPAAAAVSVTPASVPWLGLLAVMLGAFISTINGNISRYGLADIRGAMHAGFDEGSWIITVQNVAQMLVAPAAVWLGRTYGARRVLMPATVAFAILSLAIPLATELPTLLTLQFAAGVASGFFVPLAVIFILTLMPPKYWAFGIAGYALTVELSVNISPSVEAWYVDHLSWHWLFWQTVPLALLMSLGVRFGMPLKALNAPHEPPDPFGLFASGAGLALLYAGLDQGNRLDWLNSGVVWGLLSAGVIVLAGFFVHERTAPHPLVQLRVAFADPFPTLLSLVALNRLVILSTAYLIPLFLGSVRGFRNLEVGQALLWIAAPQIVTGPLAALLLRRVDARFVASAGFLLMCAACLLVAHSLTPNWGTDQFLPSQLIQAIGQCLALSGIMFFSVLHLRPQDALTFGAVLQTARLLGGEVGTAIVVTLARVRGQVASNLIGLHLQSGDARVLQRVGSYAAATSSAGYPPSGAARGAAVLVSVVRRLATTQAVIDCFILLAASAAVALAILALHRAAPQGPASPTPRTPRATTRP
jgi:MFS transporter, DHA2 family, multidrug resistance protein